MKKTFLLVTLALVLTAFTGCGSKTAETDNSEVLAKLASMEETMNSSFDRIETKMDSTQPSTVSPEQAPAEQPAETQEIQETQEQVIAEQPAKTEEAQQEVPAAQPAESQEQVSGKLQVYVMNNNKLISVKVVEGTLSSDCVHNPTDLGCPDGGVYRDSNFIFMGEKVSQVNWVNGNTFENKEGYFPKAQDDTVSHLYFCMDEENSNGKADGVYCFTAFTENGKAYSFCIQYYKNDIIH